MGDVHRFRRKKRGPAVYLTLTGRARDAVRELSTADIGRDNGLKKIIDKLDTLFLQDENARAYVTFKEFHNFKR